MRRIVWVAIGIAAVGAFVAVGLLVLFLLTTPGPREAPGWTLRAPIPEPRGETAAVVADGRIHVIGGLAGRSGGAVDTVGIYNPASDAWADGPPLPAPRHHTAAAVIGSGIYLAGGGDGGGTPQPNLWRLEVGGDVWTQLAPMPEPRYGHRMVALEDRLYVVGGIGGTDATLVYDPATDAWEAHAPIPVGRDHLSAVAVGEEIWVIGGRNANGIQARVDIYDPAADAWRDGPPLPAPTSGAADAVAMDGGIILLSGGEDVGGALGDRIVDRHWWLDTRSADPEWRELPPPPLAVHGVQGTVVDGRYHVISGATRPGGRSFLAWTDATQTFDLDELPGGAAPPTATLLAVGDIATCEVETDDAVGAAIAQQEGVVAALGDLVYPSGSEKTYRECYDPAWGAVRDRTRPAIGNHDIVNDAGAAYYAYFGDAAGEPGEGWYSYDLGAWHVVVLNSNCDFVDCEPGSPQHEWLVADLAASDSACALAYFHHPIIGSGHHGSYPDVAGLWATLDEGGVDLVLAGHEHHYERLLPLGTDGAPDPEGIPLIIVGTGGIETRPAEEPVPGSEVLLDDSFGFLRLTLEPDGYAWSFQALDGDRLVERDAGTGGCR